MKSEGLYKGPEKPKHSTNAATQIFLSFRGEQNRDKKGKVSNVGTQTDKGITQASWISKIKEISTLENR